MSQSVEAWLDMNDAEMPYKRARTESMDRTETPNAMRSSLSPPRADPSVGPTGSVSGLSPESVDSQTAGAEETAEEEGLLMVTPPATALAAAETSAVAALTAHDLKVPSTALRVLASRAAAKPRVNKSVVTLHSVDQLERLLAPTSLQASARVSQPAAGLERPNPLHLHAGETIMVLVHQGKEALDALVNEHTAEMSMMRVFTLDVAALPPQDYEVGRRSASLTAQSAADRTSSLAVAVELDDKEEEETLIAPVRRQSLTSHSNTLLDMTEADSLSNQLQHATDPVMERLTRLFQVDTSLCPWLSFGLDGGHHGTATTAATQKTGKEIFPMPAMVVWRAAGAPRDEYPPAPPQTYSSQPAPSQSVKFPDRMTLEGGPLVVKEVHTVDQVHSLSLWQPVYTLPHLLRTILDSIRAHPAHRTGDTSRGRSVIYLGASWCPPCMRIVGELPLLTAEGLPPTVHTWMKADMDFAKPIFDFFKVEIIPTFIVLENVVLLECERKLKSITDPTAHREAMEAAFSKADLGHLQNSSRPTVSLFIEKNSKSLSFDEDF